MFWYIVAGVFAFSFIGGLIKKCSKTPEQRAKEREAKKMAKYIADEINKNAWWI